jgi:hypothetical protein
MIDIEKFKIGWLQDVRETYSPLWAYAYIIGVCSLGFVTLGWEGVAVMLVCIVLMILCFAFMF